MARSFLNQKQIDGAGVGSSKLEGRRNQKKKKERENKGQHREPANLFVQLFSSLFGLSGFLVKNFSWGPRLCLLSCLYYHLSQRTPGIRLPASAQFERVVPVR